MEEEITLKSLFTGLFENKKIIIIFTVLCLILGIFYYNINIEKTFQDYDTIYKASESFVLGNISSKTYSESDDFEYYSVYDGNLINDNNLELYSKLLKSEETYEEISEKFDVDIENENWKDLVSINYDSDTKIISITFKYTDSEVAMKVVKELVSIFEEGISEINSAYEINPTVVIDEDVKDIDNTSNIDSSLLKKSIAIPVLGFLAICFIIALAEVLRNPISSEEDLERVLKSKNLAVITDQNYESQLKMVRINTEECKTILITDCNGINAKLDFAENLAKSIASLDKKVILIDLEKSDNKGLADFLNSDDKFVEKYANKTDTKNLSVITLGSDIENITELIESKKMVESIEALEKLFDKVIINSSNILNSPNTLVISKISKFTILNVKRRKEHFRDVLKAKKNIEDVGGQLLGTILYK